jgi:hypothetical protein
VLNVPLPPHAFPAPQTQTVPSAFKTTVWLSPAATIGSTLILVICGSIGTDGVHAEKATNAIQKKSKSLAIILI